MNKSGLSVGTFYFPTFASYAEITADNQSVALSPTQFPTWILTQFSNLEDLKNALPNVRTRPNSDQRLGIYTSSSSTTSFTTKKETAL